MRSFVSHRAGLSEPTRVSPSRRSFLRTAAAAMALSPWAAPSVHAGGQEPALRVRIWCEGTAPPAIYPDDVDGAVALALQNRAGLAISRGRLTDADQGLSDQTLDATDVLVWWGRLRHDELADSRANAIVDRVNAGRLGFVALHTAYASKPFRSLMKMPCEPQSWEEEGRAEHVAIAAPDHPIARDVSPFVLPRSAMFVEPFLVPEPETAVLLSSWDGGPTFRSGMTWTCEQGRVVYLRPGDDSFPVLFHPSVRQLVGNAVEWAGRRAGQA